MPKLGCRGGGSQDGFVTKLNPSGSSLVYSTFLGGSGADGGNGIALDPQGNAYVTGQTTSTNFPDRSLRRRRRERIPLEAWMEDAADILAEVQRENLGFLDIEIMH